MKKLNRFTNLNYTIPIVAVIAFVIILSALLVVIYINSFSNQKRANDLLADSYSKKIEWKLKVNTEFLNLLETELLEGNLVDSTFQNIVSSYLRYHPELINITWVDSNFTIKSVCPLKGNAHIIGLKVELPMPKKASRLAKKLKQTIYTEPFEAIQGESSFEAWNPVFYDNKFNGFFTAVYSSNEVINTWIGVDKYSNSNFNLLNGDNMVITEFTNSVFDTNVISTQKVLTSMKNGLKLQVKNKISSPFTPLVIVIIVFLSSLIAGIAYSLRKLKNTQILLLNKEILLINQNKDLKRAKERAEESDRLKLSFLTNMSHEIRTPMNGILGFSSLLKEPNLSNEKKNEYLSIIEISGERLLDIIDDIISISKIESGQMELNMTELNINEQIEYTHHFFDPETKKKNIQLTFHNSLSLSESIIITDRVKISAILTNLVKNAIKYSDNGAIDLGYIKKDDFLEFYVKDTGIGIKKEDQKVIFERFIQSDVAVSRVVEGNGLGLSISEAYVNMLGGEIWVESKVGKGSAFYFTVPYKTPVIVRDIKKDIEVLDVEVPQSDKLKILIVEDDETSEKFISLLVKDISRHIIKAKTGKEAVIAFDENPDIDLVLMDIQLPELNGYEATRQIRKISKDAIIIAQTAFGLYGDEEKAINAGCNDYIAKPIKAKELDKMISKYFYK